MDGFIFCLWKCCCLYIFWFSWHFLFSKCEYRDHRVVCVLWLSVMIIIFKNFHGFWFLRDFKRVRERGSLCLNCPLYSISQWNSLFISKFWSPYDIFCVDNFTIFFFRISQCCAKSLLTLDTSSKLFNFLYLLELFWCWKNHLVSIRIQLATKRNTKLGFSRKKKLSRKSNF